MLSFAPFLSRIPRQVWIGLGVALLLLGLFIWHQRHAHNALKAEYARGKADEGARNAKKALEVKAKIDAMSGKITAALKEKNNETNRRIAGDASALLVRGPGKASCPGNPGISSATSGHVAPARPANAAVAPLPNGERIDLIALPFAPTIQFGQQHDQCQSDLKSYREWEVQISEAWAKIGADR